jgi:putative holliday junction resolvase
VRALGLDVGARRIGVALSDELKMTAQPLEVIDRRRCGDAVARIASLCAEHEVDTIVVGMPLSMSGGARGSSSLRAEELAARLERELAAKVVLWDERFSTAEAERVLLLGDVRRDKRREVVDKVAAALILQGYLDAR